MGKKSEDKQRKKWLRKEGEKKRKRQAEMQQFLEAYRFERKVRILMFP